MKLKHLSAANQKVAKRVWKYLKTKRGMVTLITYCETCDQVMGTRCRLGRIDPPHKELRINECVCKTLWKCDPKKQHVIRREEHKWK